MDFTFTPDGRNTHVELKDGEETVSSLWIVPFTLRVGAATVRMDGFAGVETPEEFRNRGYCRRVIEATLAHMSEGDAALTMLYGIPNLYPKFGFVTAGPDYLIVLRQLGQVPPLPAGWTVRDVAPGDFPDLQALYEKSTRDAVGAAIREPHRRSVQRLRALSEGPVEWEDRCLVLRDACERVRAYAWLAQWHWYVKEIQGDRPDALLIGEALADSPDSADALVAACRRLVPEEAAGRGKPIQEVVIGSDPGGHVWNAARRQSAWLTACADTCGGSMARVLSVRRLMESLSPELSRRLGESVGPSNGSLRLVTDLGGLTLRWRNNAIEIDDEGVDEGEMLTLPQTELARLALGAFPPDDILDRVGAPLSDVSRLAVSRLFPLRQPHMQLPDRF